MDHAWLHLVIDVVATPSDEIQTFVPPGRPLPPNVFEVGIGLREDARGKRYGREALSLLTDWLFEHAGAERVEAPTDPDNLPMRTVFERLGWELVGGVNEFEREWVMYEISRPIWDTRSIS